MPCRDRRQAIAPLVSGGEQQMLAIGQTHAGPCDEDQLVTFRPFRYRSAPSQMHPPA
jgi:hypothetical protein